MITITKRMEIDAGHRLQNHESKCRNVHGHRYAFELTVTAAALDAVGRVIDFGVVKRLIGAWLDENWDHGFIVQRDDPIREVSAGFGKVFTMTPAPTAENLAEYLGRIALTLLPPEIKIVAVRCWETPTCHADWTP